MSSSNTPPPLWTASPLASAIAALCIAIGIVVGLGTGLTAFDESTPFSFGTAAEIMLSHGFLTLAVVVLTLAAGLMLSSEHRKRAAASACFVASAAWILNVLSGIAAGFGCAFYDLQGFGWTMIAASIICQGSLALFAARYLPFGKRRWEREPIGD